MFAERHSNVTSSFPRISSDVPVVGLGFGGGIGIILSGIRSKIEGGSLGHFFPCTIMIA